MWGFNLRFIILQPLGLDISAYKNVTAWLARCRSEMPGYSEVNEPGVEELGKEALSRLQGNKM
jgi:hypothetical protein